MGSDAPQFRIIASRSRPGVIQETPQNPSEDPANIRLYVPLPAVKESRRTGVVKIGRLILFGGGPQYELPLIDIRLTRTTITFPPGTPLATGEIFEIVRPIRANGEFSRPRRGPRRVAALVKIIGIEQETRAVVRVLAGSVRRGFWAERLDDDRIADHLYTL